MPPELLRGTGWDGQGPGLSDAWALGCVASFCLQGRPLYLGSAKEVKRYTLVHSCSIVTSPSSYQCQFETVFFSGVVPVPVPLLAAQLYKQHSLTSSSKALITCYLLSSMDPHG
jgi:serine/threonine protein kinase